MSKKQDIESAIYIASNMVAVSEKRCDMEESRFDSLFGAAAKVLTSISIISVTLMALLNLLYTNNFNNLELIVPYLYPIAIFILGSFICALLVLWQKPYHIFGGETESRWESFSKDGIKGWGYESVWQSAKYYVKGLEEYANSMNKRNNTLKIQLQFSIALLFISVVLVAIMLGYYAYVCFLLA